MTDTAHYKLVENLSKALRLMKIFHDLTQKELAEKLGISKSYLSEIESGKKTPTINLLKRYSEVFDVPIYSIIFFAEHFYSDVDLEKTIEFVDVKIIFFLKFIKSKNFSDNNIA
ncbi:helix-turn-helix domain-containing protein [Scytonema sp. PCC 10023]|uniref:helix-turn-helix domain-containing protein n=1 Tax=Scytonema sp. PCC 10023 TaxID=1680591 RepID=UPI0039C64FF6